MFEAFKTFDLARSINSHTKTSVFGRLDPVHVIQQFSIYERIELFENRDQFFRIAQPPY